ncbi:MAG: hypothetical protein D6757_06715 [Alphaproteobacteria bacterium]|nr:MAG: hypothetical protein D6757_06715 [Alphaproteobacteria bacterium]
MTMPEPGKSIEFRSAEGHVLVLEPVDFKGGRGFVLTLRGCGGDDGGSQRYCGCNGVYLPCPEGKSPWCDCTTDPPRLTCV